MTTDQKPDNPPEGKLNLGVAVLRQGTQASLPRVLQPTSRSAGGEVDPLLARVTVEGVYDLSAATRGEGGGEAAVVAATKLLAIETEDGTTVLIRSDTLAEKVAQLRPEALDVNGTVDFRRFRDPKAAARGIGDVLWKTVSVLRLPEDGILDEAREQALAWAREKLGDVAADRVFDTASFLGAKALMWKIESRLAGRPGLYHWHDQALAPGDRCLPGDPRLADMAAGKAALVLIHGTASHTQAAFADLRGHAATWQALAERFPGGIFGYEHRTFSESPPENAVALLEALPAGARVSLVSHSRGGLVGDLLCLGQVSDAAIDAYRIDTRGSDDAAGLEREAAEERARLRRIRQLAAEKGILVQRYVRVACPARGTRFLSDNLDAALSDFLNLLQWSGSAAAEAVAGALGGPVAAEAFGKGASSLLGVLKRLLLEIAGRRIDPRLVPGIAAMRTDSPLAAFLAHPGTLRRDGIAMAVIAGDTEFEGFGLADLRRRVANLFCDWKLFDRNDNDLVVDTDSMFAGLGFRDGAHYLYDQDSSVTHFRYFRNPLTRDALGDWLAEPPRTGRYQPLGAGPRLPWKDRPAAVARAAAGPRPAVVLVPGIMGTHIEVGRGQGGPGDGDRIWFNPLRLGVGQLARIRDPQDADVTPEDLFEMFYGDLADHLAESHEVIRCPYDWRRPLADAADILKGKIDQAAAAQPGQPIRLLAHSMGGLVARTLMEQHPGAWQRVLDSGGSLVMLGTPNHGAHLMVHTLLGKTGSMRMLEKLDFSHGLQEVLDIVAGFPGALSLLPRPGFKDAGDAPCIATGEYWRDGGAQWAELKARNTDRWYGDGICGLPVPGALAAAALSWNQVLPDEIRPEHAKRVSYVFGQGEQTPCGVQREGDRLKLLFTADGDGSVTWESGRLANLAEERCWYMPVEHADLTGEEDYFPAIVDLLERGATDRLGRLPRTRGEASRAFVLEAPPPVVPGEEELARAFLGSGPRRRKASRGRQVLRVAAQAGDLRHAQRPVLCGHYVGDAISGAEAALDSILKGTLSERERLGVYAGEVGTSAIVLQPPNAEERARGSLPGAVVVGLGQFTGQLSARQIGETVRAAVLRFLLQLRDVVRVGADEPVQLYSVLIGWGSTTSISVGDSVAAITRGVLEANRQFGEAAAKGRQPVLAVTDLCFIDLYRDAAISAAQAVATLPDLLAAELRRLGARIEAAPTLAEGEGVLDRLAVASEMGHWSRLIVTDADAPETPCPPECYEVRVQSPLPREVLERLCRQARCAEEAAGAAPAPAAAGKPADAAPAASRYYPERLKYVFLSERARAEMVWQRRQPGLIEALIAAQRGSTAHDAELGHTLFQLMVPLDFKSAAREQPRLLLVLDGYTANLPWELLHADGEPLVMRTPMVRQLATARFRPTVRTANVDTACIIVNPSSEGFARRFPGDAGALPGLAGAEKEGEAIRDCLKEAGWNPNDIVLGPPERPALDVFKLLYQRPWRILAIGAHGVFEAAGRDGNRYTGVVLSGGLLLTAVEIAQMEVVPEVVFLNCCHLGSMSNPYSEPNRFAYSLARELIEMGVRCVVAAGWAVDDEAACTFTSTFFGRLAAGERFGDAVYAARRETYRRHPGNNTWGAYQAYGDPGYRLHAAGREEGGGGGRHYVAVEQLLADLRRGVADAKRAGSDGKPRFAEWQRQAERWLAKAPPAWAGRPDVQQALGAYYAEAGAEGFALAREAYGKAIHGEDKSGRVAVRAIEQLANLEARHGAGLGEGGQAPEAAELIAAALARLEGLAQSTAATGLPVNPERAALEGSAWKRLAGVLAGQAKTWDEAVTVGAISHGVRDVLAKSAACYRAALPADPAAEPYNALNWLSLAWLADTLGIPVAEAAALAGRCGDVARKRFGTSKGFWDAVMSADARMTAWLMRPGSGTAADGLSGLSGLYREATERLPASDREWDSVVDQWRLLARFLRLRNGRGDPDGKAQALEALAGEFRPGRPAATAPGTATAASASEPASGAGSTARAGSRAKSPAKPKPDAGRKGGKGK
ncbi:MAG: CHAT domain-containing protein [Rhodocyclaceae bacterium]|nr:CHAT domain-containing protein [Rhodocyclaceae bacterium]